MNLKDWVVELSHWHRREWSLSHNIYHKLLHRESAIEMIRSTQRLLRKLQKKRLSFWSRKIRPQSKFLWNCQRENSFEKSFRWKLINSLTFEDCCVQILKIFIKNQPKKLSTLWKFHKIKKVSIEVVLPFVNILSFINPNQVRNGKRFDHQLGHFYQRRCSQRAEI